MRTDDPARLPTIGPRGRHLLVMLLTVHSGYTDAIGFLVLGGAFTSVMTGNMVLFGVAAAGGHATLAEHIAVAIVGYIIGCAAGAAVAGTPTEGQPVWPAAVTRAVAAELGAFTAFALGWWAGHGHPGPTAQLLLLACSSLGLGIQSSAIQRLGVSGLSTTYMTGTLTMAVVRLTTGQGLGAVSSSLKLLCGLVTGAIGGALTAQYLRTAIPLVQLVLLATVLIATGATKSRFTPTRLLPPRATED